MCLPEKGYVLGGIFPYTEDLGVFLSSWLGTPYIVENLKISLTLLLLCRFLLALKNCVFSKVQIQYRMKGNVSPRDSIEVNVPRHLIYGRIAKKITWIPLLGCVFAQKWT